MRIRSATAQLCSVADGRKLHKAIYSGMSISTGSFLIIGGSVCLNPASNCVKQGIILSCAPVIFVGLEPQAKDIVVAMAVRALVTVGAVTWRPWP